MPLPTNRRNSGDDSAPEWAPPRPRLTVVQSAGIVIRHLIPVGGVLFLGWSAGQFLLLSMFNIALSLASIGTIGVAVSARQKAGGGGSSADGLRAWLGLIAGGLFVTLLLTAALGWWIVPLAANGGHPLFNLSLVWSAISMVLTAAPGLRHQYQTDLGSTLGVRERKERDQANAMALFVYGILIYLMGSWSLTLTMIGATALFIARDLRPDLIRGLIQSAVKRPRSGHLH
jgi:hypothetical protein